MHSPSEIWCGRQDLNLHGCPPEPKSGVSANSTTPANSRVFYHSLFCLSSDVPRGNHDSSIHDLHNICKNALTSGKMDIKISLD